MITYNIEAVIGRNNPEKKAVVKCHDTGVCLCVSLKTERKASKWRTIEEAYTIPVGSSVMIKITKPNKKYVLQDGTYQGNKATFELPPQSFTAAGMAEAEVNIFGKDGRRITTETFYIEVPKEVADDCAEDSKTYVSIMAEQIQAAVDAAERAENAAKRAESAGENGGGTGNSQPAENGATFTPAVSEDGDLSWSNDKGLENPKTVNIKGPRGDPGKDGDSYALPMATPENLGGVMPVAKTDDMTVPVGVDAAGGLWVNASGGTQGGEVVDSETFETLIDCTTEETVAEFQVPIGTDEIVAKIQKATDIYLLISIPRDAEGDTTTESVGNITLSLYTTWKQSLFSDVSIITSPSHTWSWGGKMLCHFTNVPLYDSRGIAQAPTLQECFYCRDSIPNSSKSAHAGQGVNVWHSYFSADSYFIVTGTQNMYKGTRFILGVSK